jgi:glycosyltransferase 2 family protein
MTAETELLSGPVRPIEPPTGWHRWRSVVYAPLGDGQRRRRGSDGARLAVAVLGLIVCALFIRNGFHIDHAIVVVLHPPPHGISWLVTTVYDVGAFGVTALLVVVALLARRWVVARDLLLSAVGTVIACGLLVVALGSDGGRKNGISVDGVYLHFPVFQIAVFMAVATAALPYLARGLQRIIEAFIVLVCLATVVAGQGLPLNVLGSLAVGWGVTAMVRLWFGSPLGLPSVNDVAVLLGELGLVTYAIRPTEHQAWGVANYLADTIDDDGSAGQLRISVYGRDATDARLLAKAGRFLFYKDSGPTLTFTRLQQVEHEAYLTLLADRAGATVPQLVEAGLVGSSGDALVVSHMPAGTPLAQCGADDIDDAAIDDLLRQLHLMHAGGLTHGAVSGETVIIGANGRTASLIDFRSGTTNSRQERVEKDLANAVAATALVLGPDRAAAALTRNVGPDEIGGVLQHLRRAGLDSVVAHALKGQKSLLEDVRVQAAQIHKVPVPKLAEPRRISWATLILVVGSLIGGWALIGVLLDVTNSFDTVVGADWVWVVITFLCAQAAFAGSAVEDVGSVTGDLPFGRVLALEVANSFSGLAGGSPAIFATRVRFFQQEGYDPSVALSSSVVVTTTSWIVKGALFLICLPLAWGSIHFDLGSEETGNDKIVWIILTVVVLVGLVVGLFVAIPKLRRLAADKVRPKLTDIWQDLKHVASSPKKMSQLFGGAVGGQLLVALALAASIRAFDDHLSVATLIVVITLASMIGGVSPVPGGMGVVEAGLILGLTSAGLSEPDATAAVFIQRLFTSYLPPVWGWFTLLWLRRREYV